MASVRQRGKKKTWYALFRDGQGKLVEKATKATTRKDALAQAEQLEQLARPNKVRLSAERMRKLLSEMHLKYLGEEMPSMTVRGYCDYWFGMRAAEVGPDSKAAYRYALDLFLAHLGPRADVDMFAMTRRDIVEFRDAVAKAKSPGTANDRMKILRMVFKSAHADGWIPENPCAEVKPAKVPAARSDEKRRGFTVDELKQVLRCCPDEEWRGIVIRSYYTGQRLKDICLMTHADEDPSARLVRFCTSKTGKTVILEMHPAYVDYALAQPSSDDPKAPLHPKAFASVMKRISEKKKAVTVTVSGQFGRILAAAGLRPKDTHRKRENEPGRRGTRRKNPLVFHSSRHTFVSRLAAAGISATVVRDMVGQDSVEVNAAYTHIDHATKSEAIRKLDNILED